MMLVGLAASQVIGTLSSFVEPWVVSRWRIILEREAVLLSIL
jgi:hypothetical protein